MALTWSQMMSDISFRRLIVNANSSAAHTELSVIGCIPSRICANKPLLSAENRSLINNSCTLEGASTYCRSETQLLV